MKWVFFALMVALFVVACAPTGPTCTEPYISNGNTCCLDQNSDSICDVDAQPVEEEETAVSCDLCPPKFETVREEVVVYKYVCTNGTIVDSQELCGFIIRSNAHLFELSEQQNPDYITEFSARPACRGEFKAAEIHLVAAQSPQKVILQAKSEPRGGFEDIATILPEGDPIDDEYLYIGFCRDVECGQITQAQLGGTGAHVVRAKLVYSSDSYSTKELLLDPTPDGDYGKKSC